MTGWAMSGCKIFHFSTAAEKASRRRQGQTSLPLLCQDGYQCNNGKGTNKENTNLHWHSGVFCVVSISMSAHVLSSIFVV
jgi:hypothetical protein